jgi:hypothetical protein
MAARLAPAAAALAVLLAAAGCGATGEPGPTAPVSVAPPDSVLFAEGTIVPTGDDEIGRFLVSKLEEASAGAGSPIEWLGARGGVYATGFDGEELTGFGVVLQSNDDRAARRFADHLAARSDLAAGIVDHLVVISEDARSLRDAVDASRGTSLAEEERYQDAIAKAKPGSLLDVWADAGAAFGAPGPIVASVARAGDRLEIDISGARGPDAPRGDVSRLLEALPADSVAAAAGPEFGTHLEAAIEGLEESGIPGSLGAGELRGILAASGLDVNRLAAGLGDAGAFLEGAGKGHPRGALVIDAGDPVNARDKVSELRRLFGAWGGETPIEVSSKGARVAVGVGGPAPALRGLDPGTEPLAADPEFRRAVEALGNLPISAFVDGPEFADAAAALAPAFSEPEFGDLEPYLRKIAWAALGAAPGGEGENAKMIVSFE